MLNNVGKLLKIQHVNCGWPSEMDYDHKYVFCKQLYPVVIRFKFKSDIKFDLRSV